MTGFVIGVIIGVLVGCLIGIGVMALCVSARGNDNEN